MMLVFSNRQEKEPNVFYSIEKDIAQYYSELVEAVREALEGNSVAEADRERLKKAVRGMGEYAPEIKAGPSGFNK